MMRKLLILARKQRFFHTLVSQEKTIIIKPSSPTPPHLKTYNLSLSDQFSPSFYMPLVFFYPTCGSNATDQLKKSLSQTLTHYYPFSGRLIAAADGSYVDCNDEGIEFYEARVNGTRLSDAVDPHKTGYRSLDHLFPNGTVWGRPQYENLVKVQVSHFDCGGLAVAVALSHKIGDGCALCSFVENWARVTRLPGQGEGQSLPLPPQFISFPRSLGTEVGVKEGKNCVSKKFVIPNSKIERLKAEIAALHPTRVEVVSSMLHGCAVRAAKGNPANFFHAFFLSLTMNMRKRMAPTLPETSTGNFSGGLMIPTIQENELDLPSLVAQIKKKKSELNGVTMAQLNEWENEITEASKNVIGEHVESYCYSSLCGYPIYKVDFGWGNPIRVTFPGSPKNFFILMDTPTGDGIEALVTLEEEDMAGFQQDEQLMALAAL